jgi:hypothetical protein
VLLAWPFRNQPALFKPLRIRGSQLLLMAGVALLAPGAVFAQSAGDQFQTSTYCQYVNDYVQFCYMIQGQSDMVIDPSTGNVSLLAVTEVGGYYIVNQGGCEDESDGNPGACVPPEPALTDSVTIYSQNLGVNQTASDSSAGQSVLTLPAAGQTLKVTQAGIYTETSYHYALFDVEDAGDYAANGTTTASVSYTPAQPTITSISPDTWQAGATTSVTISGSNFGSSPTVSLSGDSYVTWTQGTASADGTTITGTVAIDPNDPGGETVTVTVAAGGSGNGFAGGEQAGAESNGYDASVKAGCPIPASETSTATAWCSSCIGGIFMVTLQDAGGKAPPNNKYNGRTVSEGISNEQDGCWFQGSEWEKSAVPTSLSSWPVGPTSQYGADDIGIDVDWVRYYQAAMLSGEVTYLSCAESNTQTMSIDTCGGPNPQQYNSHTDSITVTATSVTATRGNASITGN